MQMDSEDSAFNFSSGRIALAAPNTFQYDNFEDRDISVTYDFAYQKSCVDIHKGLMVQFLVNLKQKQ